MAFLNVRIDDRLKEELDLLCARKRIALQEATADAVRLWIRDAEGGVNTEEGFPLRYADYARKLARLLTELDRNDSRAVRDIIDLWLKVLPEKRDSRGRSEPL